MKMNIAGYSLDLLIVGFPGKSVCHGGLGWSTVALLRGHGRVALIDTGPIGMRSLIREKLKQHGLAAADITDVLLTHSHHDHSINWTMFPNARIHIGEHELAWSLEQPWGETPVPELYVRELSVLPRTVRIRKDTEILPHLNAFDAPGHTPGHLVFVLEGDTHDVIFTGDAAKTRAELVSETGEASLDHALSTASIREIWRRWRSRPGTVVVPGHDVPMVLRDDKAVYLESHQAAVKAYFGDSLEDAVIIELVPQRTTT